jgi:hypothetical protein
VVGTLYVVDMSAWATADRSYTLPATAAVGDRIGVMVTAGDASHELILKANTGDTLNGVSAAEWSRLFITGEVVIMRCVTASAAWIVEYDGRIPMALEAYDGAGTTWNAAATVFLTLGTVTKNVGDCLNTTSTDSFIARRAGMFLVNTAHTSPAIFADTNLGTVTLKLNPNGANTEINAQRLFSPAASYRIAHAAAWYVTLAAGDEVAVTYTNGSSSNSTFSTAVGLRPSLCVGEVL